MFSGYKGWRQKNKKCTHSWLFLRNFYDRATKLKKYIYIFFYIYILKYTFTSIFYQFITVSQFFTVLKLFSQFFTLLRLRNYVLLEMLLSAHIKRVSVSRIQDFSLHFPCITREGGHLWATEQKPYKIGVHIWLLSLGSGGLSILCFNQFSDWICVALGNLVHPLLKNIFPFSSLKPR